MPTYVAFLRAINVGGHTVKMADLRLHFATLGFAEAETFIASGNVIFAHPSTDTKRLEGQIETGLKAVLGYPVATFLRTPAELMTVAQHQPFASDGQDGAAHSLYIAFVGERPSSSAQEKLHTFTSEVDAFHVRGREIYWLCRKNMSESTFSGALLEKTLGQAATMRNITTVKKLAAKYGS